MSDAEKEDKTLLEENDSDTDADESNASESHSATPSQDVSDDKHLRKLQAKDVEEYDDAEKLMAINVQNIDTSTLCDNCTTRYKEFKSNVFQNKGWMIWETLMVTFDFALDISVVISYFQLKETFPAVVLMLIIINYMLVHFWESNRAGQPFWVAISGTGSMYESYKSWGLEKPTVSWDKVRYRYVLNFKKTKKYAQIETCTFCKHHTKFVFFCFECLQTCCSRSVATNTFSSHIY